jgi:hypothetical protein
VRSRRFHRASPPANRTARLRGNEVHAVGGAAVRRSCGPAAAAGRTLRTQRYTGRNLRYEVDLATSAKVAPAHARKRPMWPSAARVCSAIPPGSKLAGLEIPARVAAREEPAVHGDPGGIGAGRNQLFGMLDFRFHDRTLIRERRTCRRRRAGTPRASTPAGCRFRAPPSRRRIYNNRVLDSIERW